MKAILSDMFQECTIPKWVLEQVC